MIGNNECIFYCTDVDCVGYNIVCPADVHCSIYCNDCRNSTIDAQYSSSLYIQCAVSNGCRDSIISCPSDGPCSLECLADDSITEYVCANTTVTCGTGMCNIYCSGDNPNNCLPMTVVALLTNSYSCTNTDTYTWCSQITVINSTAQPTTPSLPPTANPIYPTSLPSISPSHLPSVDPSLSPTHSPTIPTHSPSTNPSGISLSPTYVPTYAPSKQPTIIPTTHPTIKPTLDPNSFLNTSTIEPTIDPTTNPIIFHGNTHGNSFQSEAVLIWLVIIGWSTLICCAFIFVCIFIIRKRTRIGKQMPIVLKEISKIKEEQKILSSKNSGIIPQTKFNAIPSHSHNNSNLYLSNEIQSFAVVSSGKITPVDSDIFSPTKSIIDEDNNDDDVLIGIPTHSNVGNVGTVQICHKMKNNCSNSTVNDNSSGSNSAIEIGDAIPENTDVSVKRSRQIYFKTKDKVNDGNDESKNAKEEKMVKSTNECKYGYICEQSIVNESLDKIKSGSNVTFVEVEKRELTMEEDVREEDTGDNGLEVKVDDIEENDKKVEDDVLLQQREEKDDDTDGSSHDSDYAVVFETDTPFF